MTGRLEGFTKIFDFFKRPYPTFNVKGEEDFATIPGCFLSFILLIIMIMYTILKYKHFVTEHNPTIIESTSKSFYNSTEPKDLTELDFKFAVGIEDYWTKANKNNKEIIRFEIWYDLKIDGVKTTTILDMHLCTKEDFD